jgi:hypothetical protein
LYSKIETGISKAKQGKAKHPCECLQLHLLDGQYRARLGIREAAMVEMLHLSLVNDLHHGCGPEALRLVATVALPRLLNRSPAGTGTK